MANEDIIFRAGFEYDEVIAGLTNIGQSAQQAAASSSASLALLGRASLDVAASWGEQYEAVSRQITIERLQAQAGKQFTDEEIANHKKLIREEKNLAEAIGETEVYLKRRIAFAARAPDTPMENIRTPGGSVSLGDQLGAGTMATRGQLSVLGDTAAAKADLERIGDVIDEMFSRGEVRATQFAGVFHTIATSLAGELHGQDLSNALKPLEDQAKRILAMFKSGDLDFSKDTNVDTMIAQMNELRAVASEFLTSSSAEAQEFGATLLAKLDQADDGFTNVHRDADVLRKDMKAITGEMKQAVSASDELEEQMGAIGKLPVDLQKKFKAKLVEIEVKRLENAIKKLGKSTSVEANKAGKEFEEMGEEIKEAYDKSEVGTKEALKGLREITAGANKAGNAFDKSFGKLKRGATNAGVPIWKLGTAMDRVGVRGAGGILRVVDAVKELGPAFIIAGVAAAGFAMLVSKLIGLAVELGKKFAKAFFEFTKSSVDAAKAIQHLDAQFSGLLQDASGKLGQTLRNFVIEQSFEFGVDLTGDFANILVPLAESTDQIAQMAEDVAAISHFRGIAVENIVNAVKQATGGHFRPFQQTLGMTPQERDRVIELQEAYGQLTGTLIGLEEFMERRGIDFEALGDSLAVAQGKITVFVKQMEIALGEPIRDTLGEEFHGLLEIIEDNSGKILQLINHIGQAVSDVIEDFGDLAEGFISSITPEDIRDVENAIDDMQKAASGFIETVGDITDEDIDSLKGAFIGLTGVVSTLVDWTGKLLEDLSDIKDILNFSFGTGDDKTLASYLYSGARTPASFPTKPSVEDVMDSSFPEVEDIYDALQKKYKGEGFQNILRAIFLSTGGGELPGIGPSEVAEFLGLSLDDIEMLGKEAGIAFGEGVGVGTDSELGIDETRFIGWKPPRADPDALAEITRRLKMGVNERRIGELNKEIKELEEKLGTVKIGIEFDQKQAAIFVNETDKLLKLEEDSSIKRRDTTIKYLNKQRDARTDYAREGLEIVETFDEKEVDILQKFRDKEDDVEEDRYKKKIKLEEKLQEKLRDIRSKFDFDAAEAIRMNDAVALLRIRRRMAFELAQAKLKHKEDIEENDDSAEEKREDNLKWLRRQIRDSKLAEQRKLEDAAQVHRQKLDDMDQQYDDELHLLALHEEDKIKEIGVWLEQSLRDLDTWHDNKMALMAEQNKEEIRQLREFQAERRRVTQENLFMAGFGTGFLGIDPTGGYQSQWPEGYTGYMPGQGPTIPPGAPITNAPPGGGSNPIPTAPPAPGAAPAPGSHVMEYERGEAIRLAIKGGFLKLMETLNATQSYETIRINLQWLRSQGLATGGIAPAGRTSLVGEKGPEPIIPMSAGIVAPHTPLNYSPGNNQGGQTINDNSQSVNADLSMLDPSQVSPMQRTIMHSIVTDEILSLGVG